MTTKTSTTPREFYKNCLARKHEELAAIDAQLARTLSDSEQLKLNNNAEQILKDIEDLDKKLSELDKNNYSPNIRNLNLEKSFQKIDFNEARKIAQSVNNKFGDASGAILLFLQRSTKGSTTK